MASYTKFYPFVEALAKKKHDLGSDQLAVVMMAEADAPSQSDGALTDLTQISYTYCSSRNITTVSCTQTSGNLKLILQDLTISASGGNVGPFRYAAVVNTVATGYELMGFYDYGEEITLHDGEDFDFDFDGTNGLFSLS